MQAEQPDQTINLQSSAEHIHLGTDNQISLQQDYFSLPARLSRIITHYFTHPE
jgi:hypothetical protein